MINTLKRLHSIGRNYYTYATQEANHFRSTLKKAHLENFQDVQRTYITKKFIQSKEHESKSLLSLLQDDFYGVMICSHQDRTAWNLYQLCLDLQGKKELFATWYISGKKLSRIMSSNETMDLYDAFQFEMKIPLVELYQHEFWNMFQNSVVQDKIAVIIIDQAESLRLARDQEGFWYSLAVNSSNVGGFKVVAFTSDEEYAMDIPRCNSGVKFSRLVWNSEIGCWARNF